jgi:DNA invertase Pin-like site-specific DNA recombinase
MGNPFPLHPGQRIAEQPDFGRLRVIGAVRLSKYTDQSTSPEVQTEFIVETSNGIGGELVGWANDTDISALKTTPWEREQLRYWLDRPEAWDALIWQRMDRAVRSMADMADLGRFAKKHGKRLIFASGPGGGRLELDFSSPMSELIMLILAFAAQLEGQTIMERNKGAAAHLQSLGRWAGGIVPYGAIPVRKTFDDGNDGWWLGKDVDLTWNFLMEMVTLALEGKGYVAIEAHLTKIGAITPKNHRNRLATPPRPTDPDSRWRDTTIRGILRSQFLRGYQVRDDGTVVRDTKGNPVRAGEALIDDDTWFQLQAALNGLAKPNANPVRRKDGHPILGILLCEHCDANMSHHWVLNRKKLRVYGTALVDAAQRSGLEHTHDEEAESLTVRVPGRVQAVVEATQKVARNAAEGAQESGENVVVFHVGKLRVDELTALWNALELGEGLEELTGARKRHMFRCTGERHEEGVPAPSIDFDETLAWIDEEFMTRLGRLQRTAEIRTGGVDNRPAIAELKADIEAVGAQLGKLRGAAADMVAQQLNGMSDTLEELEKTPFIPAQTRTVRLGQTWGHDWIDAGWPARRQMLVDAGVRVYASSRAEWRRQSVPVAERLRFEIGTHVTPEEDALDDVAYQESL